MGIYVTELEMKQMKRFMQESYFTFTDEWLHACLEWVKQTYPTKMGNSDFVKTQLWEQWQDTNLEGMECACLPANLKAQRNMKLTGKYGLQINSVRDIGESSYSQWTKLKKLENENVSVEATDSTECKPAWQPSAKRCLYLSMTDGSQSVFGLELQTVPDLSLNMKPGIKIVIIGPVNCRLGVIHLKPGNVKIIGGEVEELFPTNTVEKMLAMSLNKRNTTSISSQSNQNTRQPLNSERSARVGLPPPPSNGIGSTFSGDFPSSEDQFQDFGDDDDDDIFTEIDEEALISTNSTNLNPQSRTTSQMTTQRVLSSGSHSIPASNDGNKNPVGVRTLSVSATNRVVKTDPVSTAGYSSCKTKSKPVFVPPTVVSTPATSNKQQTSTSDFTSASSLKPSATGSSKTTSSRPATTAATSNNSGRQQKISKFMKPMPLVIDPPTPERQLKRRKQSTDEEIPQPNICSMETQLIPENYNTEACSNTNTLSSNTDTELGFDSSPPDDSLMQIIDNTIESRLLETEGDDAGFEDTSTKLVNLYPKRISGHPYVFLSQVQENYQELAKQSQEVRVKGCISTVVSNIQISNGCWTLSVCINDGTGYLNCKISASILNNIIGFTPEEMKRLKAKKSVEGKQRIAEGMNGLAKKLVHINGIFVVQLEEECPVITQLIDLLMQHKQAIRDKLSEL